MEHISNEALLRDTFPFFALPKEVRYMILELLLVRKNVALCLDRAIKQRFPDWNQERPQWELRAVNRQMRAEAGDIVYSAQNTFFVPFGGVEDQPDGKPLAPRIPWPPVRRLDCAFDMRDVIQDGTTSLHDFETDERVHERSHGTGSFDKQSLNDRMFIMHQRKLIWIRSTWMNLMEAIGSMSPPPALLRLDLTHCRCPWGCCRLSGDAVSIFHDFFDLFDRVEMIGTDDASKEGIVSPLEDDFAHREPSSLEVVVEESGAEYCARTW